MFDFSSIEFWKLLSSLSDDIHWVTCRVELSANVSLQGLLYGHFVLYLWLCISNLQLLFTG